MTKPAAVCQSCGRVVLEVGRRFSIEAAFDRQGRFAVVEFLDWAVGRKKLRPLVEDIAMRLEDFARTGDLRVPRELNQLDKDLWEIKCGTLRLPFYYTNDGCADVRLTHGFVKGTKKAPLGEIDKGLAIMREDRER